MSVSSHRHGPFPDTVGSQGEVRPDVQPLEMPRSVATGTAKMAEHGGAFWQHAAQACKTARHQHALHHALPRMWRDQNFKLVGPVFRKSKS